MPTASAISALVGSRPKSPLRRSRFLKTCRCFSRLPIGIWVEPVLEPTYLLMACFIHQVAYVENLNPLLQSNFLTAYIRPKLPSWINSDNGKSADLYFKAT